MISAARSAPMSSPVMFATVGYRRRYWESSYPTVKIYGLYKTKREARQRQIGMCGLSTANGIESVCTGHGYTVWIKKISLGDTIGCNLCSDFETIGK